MKEGQCRAEERDSNVEEEERKLTDYRAVFLMH